VSNSVRSLWSLLGLVVFATAPALGYASPPDPSWIQGIYDDDDDDYVVSLATSGNAHVAPPVPTHCRPVLPVLGNLSDSSQTAPCLVSGSAVRPRAPPVP